MARNHSENVADPHEALAKAEAKRFAAKAAFKEVLNDRGNRIYALNEKSGPKSKPYRDAEHELERSRAEYDRIKAVLRRPLSKWHVRPAILLAVGTVLALLEAPVNKFLFDVALQSSSFASYTISIMFAAVLLILAHVCGRSLRQVWSEYRTRIVWSSVLIFILTLGVLFTLVSILTVARASFASSAGTIQDLFSGVRSSLGAHGIFGTLANAFSDMSALVLVTVNVGGIFMTMMLAFFTHDPDKDFDQAAHALAKDQKHLNSIHRVYVEAKGKIIKAIAPDLAGYSANHKTANMTVIEFKRKLGRPLDEDDREVIDDLDQMSEDAEKDEAGEWDRASSAHAGGDDRPADYAQPHLRPVESARRSGT
jgi:hypothetical protein